MLRVRHPKHFAERRFLSNSHEQDSDLELARFAREGDESAFEEILRRYSPRVFRFAGKFFRQRSLVEEAAQEVFLKAFTELGSYEGRGSMEGWLTRITTNTCLNMLRSSKRRPELTVSDLTQDETTWLDNNLADAAMQRHQSSERSLVAADLAGRVLETLAPDDQLVLTLIDGEDASVKDVVKMTGWSESKVKVQAFRARRRMRQAVEKLLGYKSATARV
ncbi:MAG TPA: RNA polymerase subunit sigma-24 [Blastocatellia bacterium]|nr:RNA polymerase subunit sigma-24 [Blastocatellia bacterium]HAF24535.1 RNA polymerase subunit sigma-24 [Blastocatellia bacterium]